MKSKNKKEQNYKKVSCPKCRCENVKKDGLRKIEYRGKIQRYRCKKCNFRFVLDEGFYRMRNHEKKITLCMDLCYKGVSFRKLQEHLQAFYPKNSHYSTIYRWIVKYATMISNLTDNIPIKSGKEIMSDEMEYHRRISKNQKGREQNWFVDTFDVETRFMITGEYMKSRTNNNLIKVLNRTKFKTGD